MDRFVVEVTCVNRYDPILTFFAFRRVFFVVFGSEAGALRYRPVVGSLHLTSGSCRSQLRRFVRVGQRTFGLFYVLLKKSVCCSVMCAFAEGNSLEVRGFRALSDLAVVWFFESFWFIRDR